MLIETEGIVLKNRKYQEGDGILVIFTRKLGKVSVMAKGTRRSKSKLLSAVQPLSHSEFILYKGKTMYSLNSGDSINTHYRIREDLYRLTMASYLVELVEVITIEGQSNNRLFNLLLETLGGLETEKIQADSLYLRFLVQYLAYNGILPATKGCTQCNSKSSSRWRLDFEEGGLVCDECFKEAYHPWRTISPKGIKLMNYLLRGPLEQVKDLAVHRTLMLELEEILNGYIQHQLDYRNFKSLKMLKEWRNSQ